MRALKTASAFSSSVSRDRLVCRTKRAVSSSVNDSPSVVNGLRLLSSTNGIATVLRCDGMDAPVKL
jgi:hypothetical protein